MLAVIRGLAHHNKKDVCLTFSSDLSEPRKFGKILRGRQRWASTHRVYTHGTGVSLRKEGYALCYPIYTIWRRHLLLLILGIKGFPRTVKGKDNGSNLIPTPFLFDGTLAIGEIFIRFCHNQV